MTGELTEVREAAQQSEAGRQALTIAVRTAKDAGHSLRAIAEAAGLSHQTIANILKETPS